MNGTGKLSNVAKVIIVAVVAAVLIIWIIVASTGSSQTAALDASSTATDSIGSTLLGANAPAPTGTAPSTGENPASAGGKTSAPIVAAPAAPVIKFVTPVVNDIWTIGNQNPIAWSAAPNVSGAISLLSAATGQSIGIILPEIGPKQTSYTWNTRDVFLNRSDPQKTDVVPGSYKIEVSFDGNNLKPIVSPAFTIIN